MLVIPMYMGEYASNPYVQGSMLVIPMYMGEYASNPYVQGGVC